jgi:hypothetical protein
MKRLLLINFLFTFPTLLIFSNKSKQDKVNLLYKKFKFVSVQERLTKQIAEAVLKAIDPRGVAVVCEGV